MVCLAKGAHVLLSSNLGIVWLLKAKNGQYPEKSGTKINLVPLDAEFSAE